ncbi:MAG: serine/threonine protein kinase [Proteobacteria bacterium]|nr:serine/threonine protein kinase [Pseudomonadota bacterium]
MLNNRFGKYFIVRKVAVGGMAEIFLAKTRSSLTVALKRIHPNLASKSKFIQMFLDEARTVIQLRHPNIVQMLDFGKIHDSYFFTMEWIDGKSLAEVVGRQHETGIKFPPEVVMWLGMDICEGLAYAHAKRDHYNQPLGIVHRDISPPNILVTKTCVAKVADFGIAEIRNKGVQTQPGVIRGKFSYMSTEQSYGEVLDQRSDIFSVGVVLYELLTDQRLFLRDNEQATIDAVRECIIPPIDKFRDDVPKQLNKVIARSLAEDSKDRYPDCPSFADDLARVLKADYPNSTRQDVQKFLSQLFSGQNFQLSAEVPDIPQKRVDNVSMKKSSNVVEGFPTIYLVMLFVVLVGIILVADYFFGFFHLNIF